MCFSTPKIPAPAPPAPAPPPAPERRADDVEGNSKAKKRTKRGRIRGVSQFRAPQLNLGDVGEGSDSSLNQ